MTTASVAFVPRATLEREACTTPAKTPKSSTATFGRTVELSGAVRAGDGGMARKGNRESGARHRNRLMDGRCFIVRVPIWASLIAVAAVAGMDAGSVEGRVCRIYPIPDSIREADRTM